MSVSYSADAEGAQASGEMALACAGIADKKDRFGALKIGESFQAFYRSACDFPQELLDDSRLSMPIAP